MKSSVLYIPAWWPCSFFEEQQGVFAEDYDVYNLYGSTVFWSKREFLRRIFLGRKVPRVSLIRKDLGSVEIKTNWLKMKSIRRSKRQLEKMSDEIGFIIKDVMDGRSPDIIHVQSISDLAVFAVCWAKKNGIRVVLTEHVLYIRRNVDFFTRIKEQVFSLADQVYCVSNYLYRNLLTNGFKMKRVSVIGNLVSSYAVPNNWNDVRKNGRIMFVASHVNDKDVPILIQVSERLKSKGKGIDVFGLTGSEVLDNEKSIGEMVLEKGLGQVLCLKGPCSHESLLELYSSYSLLLSTSVSETFGLSVAEAIAHGTPVVCTDSGGVRDFVNEGNGIVVPIRDVESIIESVEKVLAKEFNFKRLSEEILSKYGIDNYSLKVLSS